MDLNKCLKIHDLAGGNAGNQSAIGVIRGLATGFYKVSREDFSRVMAKQAAVGLLLGLGLSGGGFLRVMLTGWFSGPVLHLPRGTPERPSSLLAADGDPVNAFAISISLFFIVMSSVMVGAALPFGLARLGIDPANAGTSIQVIMDVSGVMITCASCLAIFEVASHVS